MMVHGFYNMNPFTPASLAVVVKGKTDDHRIIYPDGHYEILTDEEILKLESEFVSTTQKHIRNLPLGETKFVLLPGGKILAGSNALVCYKLIQWYKSAKSTLDSSTKVITKKYIVFLLETLRQNYKELKEIHDHKIIRSFTRFLQKIKNPELAKWYGQFEIQQRANERIQKLRDISLKLKSPQVLAEMEEELVYTRRIVHFDKNIPRVSESQISRYTLKEENRNKGEQKADK